jgi:hypothetical protein
LAGELVQPALDSSSLLVLRAGTGEDIQIALLPGTEALLDPAIYTEMAASREPSPNYMRTLCMPVFRVRCRVFKNWFNVGWLNRMFARGANGVIINNLGPIYWKYANLSPVAWSGCKLEQLELDWKGRGTAIEATLTLRPYGLKLPNPTFINPAISTKRPFHTQSMTYNGTLYGVEGGKIIINNQLSPLLSDSCKSYDRNRYPRDYDNGPIEVKGFIRQQSVTDAYVLGNNRYFTVIFTNTEEGSSKYLGMNIGILPPALSQQITLRVGTTLRAFKGHQYHAGGNILTVWGSY